MGAAPEAAVQRTVPGSVKVAGVTVGSLGYRLAHRLKHAGCPEGGSKVRSYCCGEPNDTVGLCFTTEVPSGETRPPLYLPSQAPKFAGMKAPITTYIVEVFDSPHWKTVLTTKDKKVALEALKPLGKHGRITELTPKRK